MSFINVKSKIKPPKSPKKQVKAKEYNSYFLSEPKKGNFSKEKTNSAIPINDALDELLYKRKTVDVSGLNIWEIDSVVKKYIVYEIENIGYYKMKLERLKSMKLQTITSNKQLGLLRKKINDLDGGMKYLLYISKTSKILKEYKDIVSKKSTNFIEKSKKDTKVTDKELQIVNKFMMIVRDYVNIKSYKAKIGKTICECGSYDFLTCIQEESVVICKNCNKVMNALDNSPSYRDNDRVNMGERYTYSRKTHFIDAIKEYQGKQHTNPNKLENVLKIIRDQMQVNNLKEENLTKKHLYTFLSKQSLSVYFKWINLLHFIITGKKCPDISEYEPQLIEDFEEQEEVLLKVIEEEDIDRSSSLNVHYKLCKLLQHRGYKCNKEDFLMLKLKSKEDDHDYLLKKTWDRLGWKWIKT